MNEEASDIRFYWKILRRWWWLLLLGVLVSGGTGFFISNTQTPIYESTTKVLIQGGQTPGAISSSDIQASQALALDYLEIVTTRPVLQGVIDSLDLPYAPHALAGKIKTAHARSTILITGTDPNPQTAADIANSTARVFIEGFVQRQFMQIAQFQASLTQMGIGVDSSLVTAQAAALSTLSIIEDAVPARGSSSPRTRLNIFLAAIVGLLVIGAMVVLREIFDDRIQSPDDLRQLTGWPVLGSVTRFRGAPDLADADAPPTDVEAYQFIQTSLEFQASADAKPLRIIAVTSAKPSEGKTTTALNLSKAMASAGKNVIMVDADLRRPSLGQLFGRHSEAGLSNLVMGAATIDEVLIPSGFDRLSVVSSGARPADPSTLLRSSAIKTTLEELSNKADILVVDTPPLLAVTDPLLLASHADGVLLVIDSERTGRQAVKRATDLINQVSAPLYGAVFNKTSSRTGHYYYYYYYSDDRRDGPKSWWRTALSWRPSRLRAIGGARRRR